MAGLFYRKIKISDKMPSTKIYGFDKRNQKEVIDITQRLSATATVNYRARSAISSRYDELFDRVVATCPHISCERDDECSCVRAVGGHRVRKMLERRFEKNLSPDRQTRIIERLRRPTTATNNKTRRSAAASPEGFESGKSSSMSSNRVQSAVSREDELMARFALSRKELDDKVLSRLQQQTTTSRHKQWNGRCWYCDSVHPVQLPEELAAKPDNREATQEEIGDILRRVRAPICSNAMGSQVKHQMCGRYQDMNLFERQHRQQWPLWCGLERSKSVSEVVNRLYTPAGKNRQEDEFSDYFSSDDEEH